MARIFLLSLLFSMSCQSMSPKAFERHGVESLDEKYESDRSYCLHHLRTNGFKRCMVLNGWHPDEINSNKPPASEREVF